MGLLLHVIDAFCDGPFTGNPAAVCLLAEPLPDARLQAIAAEMNLSETAFLLPRKDGHELRWFTPTVEVDLCGHATLAAAHFLYTSGLADPAAAIAFHTKSGLLRALPAGGGIELAFPLLEATPTDVPPAAAEVFGAAPVRAYRTRQDLVLELESEAAVRASRPSSEAVAALGSRGVAITAPGERYDFVSRFFAPAAGIPEDPVTGSIHCALAPLWAERLGKTELRAYQASVRGGELLVILEEGRCHLLGRCETVLRGELAADVV